jgi:hypothetical protein
MPAEMPGPRFQVLIDDNFHYQDPAERREHGIYANVEDALAACRAIVDRSLQEQFRPGISAEALFNRYTSFGDDPFIVAIGGDQDERTKFSAWSYARERARAICGVP